MAKDVNDNTPAGATALDYILQIQMLAETIDFDRLPDDECRKAIVELLDKIENARVTLGDYYLLINDPDDAPPH
jgi:hypothetical protein